VEKVTILEIGITGIKMIRSFTFSICLLLIIACFSSCCCFGRKSCCDFGRGPILCSKSECIIDYNDCFQEVCIDGGRNCLAAFSREPLTEDMFDPFAPIDAGYKLARGDILQIAVFGEEETTIENAMIAPDGKIYYTVLDGLQAEGLTPGEVANEIKEGLSPLFLDPMVTVTPKATQTLNYRVLGRVEQPGEYPINGPVTLSEGISEAGGLLSPASKEQDNARRYLVPYYDLEASFIARGPKKLDVDFQKLLHEGDNKQNVYLRPGDYIYIAGSEVKEIYVLGYVTNPQRLPFITGMTLMSALASVGGWPTPNPYSPDMKNIIVIRGSLECPQVCHVNLENILCGTARDLYLQPGDIVYATHKHFRFLRDLTILALDAFASSFASGAGDYYSNEWFVEQPDDDTGGTTPTP
jgi:polysaccharide export outer membrane protein